MPSRLPLTAMGYHPLDEASQQIGLRAMLAALSVQVPRLVARLTPRGVLGAKARFRRPMKRTPTTVPYSNHTNEQLEIACVLGGRCIIKIHRQYFETKEGDVCVFAPQVEHTDTFLDRRSTYSLLWFTVGSRQVSAHLTRYSRRTGFNIVYRTTCEAVLFASRVCRNILCVTSPPAPGRDSLLHIKAGLLELAALLLNALLRSEGAPYQDWRGKLIDEVADYLQAHYLENPSLSQISSHVRLSPNYLCTLFRKYTGQTLFTYMNSLRMTRAQELLVTSHLSMKEIARETGFHSAHYFSRCFHRLHGVAPTAFRATHPPIKKCKPS